MIFCNLGSGSKGNCSYVRNSPKGSLRDGKAVLIDQGFSLKNLHDRLTLVNLSSKDIAAVIVTHEHADHMIGAGVFARRYHVPVYMTEKTQFALANKSAVNSPWRTSSPSTMSSTRRINAENLSEGSPLGRDVQVQLFSSGDTLKIEGMELKTFHTPHDAADSIGIVISSERIPSGGDQTRIAVITDLGSVTQSVLHHIADPDLLFLESNHDFWMLTHGPYPLPLQQRIKSRVGHLSNEQSVELFKRIRLNGRFRHLVLGHLSEVNNDPKMVMELFQNEKSRMSGNFNIEIANQYFPGTLFNL